MSWMFPITNGPLFYHLAGQAASRCCQNRYSTLVSFCLFSDMNYFWVKFIVFLCFFFFFFWLHRMQDIRSPTRDRTHAPFSGSTGFLTTGLPGTPCSFSFFKNLSQNCNILRGKKKGNCWHLVWAMLAHKLPHSSSHTSSDFIHQPHSSSLARLKGASELFPTQSFRQLLILAIN